MLAEIRGLAEEVIPGPEIHDDFCHDELAGIHCRPEVLVRARSTEEVSRVMKYAYEHHVPVTFPACLISCLNSSQSIFPALLLINLFTFPTSFFRKVSHLS